MCTPPPLQCSVDETAVSILAAPTSAPGNTHIQELHGGGPNRIWCTWVIRGEYATLNEPDPPCPPYATTIF